MKRVFWFASVCILLDALIPSTSAVANSRAPFPVTWFQVTVRQTQEDGSLSKSIHVVDLSCGGNACQLRILTLNQCFFMGGPGEGFYPKIEEFSISDGSLAVDYDQSQNAVEVRYSTNTSGGTAQNTLRFEYEYQRGDGAIHRVVGFQGAYVKSSTILKRIVQVRYVPIAEFEQVPMDCPAGGLMTVRKRRDPVPPAVRKRRDPVPPAE